MHLSLRQKPTKCRETGSPFDVTDITRIQTRAGGHDSIEAKPVEISAFSYNRKTTPLSPSAYLKKHTGNGGAVLSVKPESKAVTSTRQRRKKPAALLERKNPPNTELRRFYDRGDLPVRVYHGGVHNRIAWKSKISALDYHMFLPIFFDGLREVELPYNFIAEQGVYDMLQAAPNKVLQVVPQLIIPIKTALNTRNKVVIVRVLKVLQAVATCDAGPDGPGLTGQALVPYYRQILPIMNIFSNDNDNLGDGIDYGQRNHGNLGELIQETLEILESHGGDDAFINIKYLIPTYQSVILS